MTEQFKLYINKVCGDYNYVAVKHPNSNCDFVIYALPTLLVSHLSLPKIVYERAFNISDRLARIDDVFIMPSNSEDVRIYNPNEEFIDARERLIKIVKNYCWKGNQRIIKFSRHADLSESTNSLYLIQSWTRKLNKVRSETPDSNLLHVFLDAQFLINTEMHNKLENSSLVAPIELASKFNNYLVN